ncbi:MAG: glycogen-binding domain-containing protein [Lentisphaeria bacterium]|nr:glycogen-binding domain-containing protein [Lentisphaeria bacterium]
MAKKAAGTTETVKRRRVVFTTDLGPGKNVSLAGNFNDWDPTAKPMLDKNGDGVYRCTLLLKPGTYEYKFVIDGVWCVDTNNPNFAPNDLGTLNSLLTVE